MADLIEQRRIDGFEQLHREFREYGRRCLYGINIFHIRHSLDFTLPDLPEELQSRYHGIGCLSLPDFDPANNDFRIATAENESAASVHDAGSKFVQGHWETFNVGSGIANVCKDHQTAAGDFRLLCERAGALVSHSHLTALPFSQIKYGYKNWANAGRFLAVMFWAKPLSASEVKQLACHGWVCWTQDPFNLAADTIERCGLASDSPQIIPHDVEWPAWAGFNPRLEGRQIPTEDGPDSDLPRRRRKREEWIGHALMLLKDHPEWPDRKIADEAGISAASLCRCEEFKLLRRQFRDGSLKKGHRNVELDDRGRRRRSSVDAESDDSIESDWNDE